MKRLTLLCAALLFAVVDAPMANAFDTCGAYLFTKAAPSVFSPAIVKGASGDRAHFHNPGKSCREALCQEEAYLLPSDHVLASVKKDGWVCVHYSPGDKEFYGWMREDRIEFRQLRLSSERADWVGKWAITVNDVHTGFIAVKAGEKPNTLSIYGQAIWPPASEAPATGGFEGTGTIKGNIVTVDDNPCKVRLFWIDGEIVASDNGKCGGMNVFFDGVYRRLSPEK